MERTWKLGRIFVVRHAGFPFDWLEQLGVSGDVRGTLDRVLEIERKVLEDVETRRSAPQRAQAADAFRRGRFPKHLTAVAEQDWTSAREALQSAWAQDRTRLRAELRTRAADPRVQEAIFLSNPAMFENVWSRYLRAEPERDNSDTRRVERQVYTYLQRLCGKNETTSFFGPMAYGELTDDPDYELEIDRADAIRRRTFFTYWAVTELGRAIGREKALRPHLPVRVNPLFELSAEAARCEPLGLSLPLKPEQYALIEAVRTEGTLARAARKAGLDEELAETLIVPLLKTTMLLRGLSVASDDLEGFTTLRRATESLPACDARERWVERLSGLEALRAEFEAGALERRRALLPQLEAAFTEYTSVPARRGEGQIYSDRLILYEEARSRFSIRIGALLAKEMEERLSGALELSAAYGEKVQGAYKRQIADTLGPQEQPLDFLSYAVRTRPKEVGGSRYSPVPPIELEPQAGSTVDLPADALGTSSDGGRYALPDVCLGGPPAGEGRRGEYGVLLSRVHHHLLVYSWLATHYEDRARFEAVSRRWLEGEPTARGLVGLSVRRRNKGFYSYPGRRLAYSISDP
ncbi:MAG: lantibiotic dehydratase, partial [Myxococcaceae bacterium]